MRFLLISALLAATAMLGGCAHPVDVAPDLTRVPDRASLESKHPARIGYYVPAELMALEVTTAGGGGDNIRYFPYRDIDAGYERALGNVFSGVVRLSAVPAPSAMKLQGIDYVVQPQIVTSSGSTGLFTWPPTNFTVDLTSSVRDADGKQVANPRVVGVGTAETGQLLFQHGFAGSRAMEDALGKTQAALRELKLSAHTSPMPAQQALPPASSVETRLTTLKNLKDKGMLTPGEYEKKRVEILNAL